MASYAPLDIGRFWEDVNDHLIQLVELIPEDKLNWSPSPQEWNFRGTLAHLIGGRYFIDVITAGPPPNPDVLADSSTRDGIKRHLRLSWSRVQAFITDESNLSKAYDVPSDGFLDPPQHTGHYIAYHRLVHDVQHRGDVMRYLQALGIDPNSTNRRRPL